jgi:magnesium chelatase family protein
MLSTIWTATLTGLAGETIRVETDIARGLPACNLVGLPDTTIRGIGGKDTFRNHQL